MQLCCAKLHYEKSRFPNSETRVWSSSRLNRIGALLRCGCVLPSVVRLVFTGPLAALRRNPSVFILPSFERPPKHNLRTAHFSFHVFSRFFRAHALTFAPFVFILHANMYWKCSFRVSRWLYEQSARLCSHRRKI
jgi:hypothetical protein